MASVLVKFPELFALAGGLVQRVLTSAREGRFEK